VKRPPPHLHEGGTEEMNPSLDKDPAPGVQGVNPQGGLLPGLEGETAPGLRGRETPFKGGENALPIKEGWGSRIRLSRKA
jgi:hypothetical protein